MENDTVNTTQEGATDAVTTASEASADQRDAFLEGFDDADTVTTADQPDERGDGEADAQDAEERADQPTETAEAQSAGEARDAGSENAPDDAAKDRQMWIVKHMDSQLTLTAKDITPELLQKGLDYDRVRGKYDEAKPVLEMFSQLAQKAGMSVTDFAKSVRAEAKKAQGLNDAEAKRVVELEDREAAVAAVETRAREEAAQKAQRDARVRNDVAEFKRAFPEVYRQAGGDPKNVIPPQVWAEVDQGFSLTAAYSRYVAASAAAQIKAANDRADTAGKNAANAARSTGSLRSAGNDAKNKDPFLEGFDG